jgi:16S rRNA processing protein RimM
MPDTEGEFVRVGQVVGAFGLKGHLKILPLTDFLERFDVGATLRVREELHEVLENKWHKNQLLLKLSGIDDLTAAESYKWAYLEAIGDERPELDEGEYLTEDLIGMTVSTAEGKLLGQIDDVLEMPAHDVLVVGSIMIPAVKEFVKDVNVEDRTVVVELIPGMEEEAESAPPAPRRNPRRRSLS